MRTTLDLPDELLKEAIKLTGAKSKTALIKTALEELILKSKRMRLLQFKGRLDLDVDLRTLRERK